MRNITEKLFIMACEMYVKNIDRFEIASTFAPLEEYTVFHLREICSLQENELLLIESKDHLLEYVKHKRFTINGAYVHISSEDISSYIYEQRTTKIVLYHLLKLAYLRLVYNNRPSHEIEEIKSIERLRERNNNKAYFRGQSLYNWRLSPTVLRGLDRDIVFDDRYYFKLLSEDGSEDKYNDLLKNGASTKLNRYDKYAFMQHSRSYSPFIDFTKDSVIATSFALSNIHNINEYRNNDSALFTFWPIFGGATFIKDKWEARDFITKQFRINVIKDKYFILGHDYMLFDGEGKTTRINISLLKDLINALRPKVALIDIPSSDRMIYQKGVFLCFYDCLCLKDTILYELSPTFIKKDPILISNKMGLLEDIYKERKYDYHHLMDPYLIFKE